MQSNEPRKKLNTQQSAHSLVKDAYTKSVHFP